MLKSAYEGLNARPKVYLSKEYFCEMYPTCVSSKLCEFISFSQNIVFKGWLPLCVISISVVVCWLSFMVFVLFIVKAEVCNEKRLTGSLLSLSPLCRRLEVGGSHQKLAAAGWPTKIRQQFHQIQTYNRQSSLLWGHLFWMDLWIVFLSTWNCQFF